MIKKGIKHLMFHRQHHSFSVVLTSSIALLSIFIMLTSPVVVQAVSVPGGAISDPVVSAVDIAKPAVVRIYTTIGGSVTVHFAPTLSATFPRDGGTYKLKFSGSGAFITAHGDILTADHVVNAPHSDLDTGLYTMAAQDVANYINQNLNPTLPFSPADALALMTNGNYRTETHYGKSSSDVYLNTDYTGTLNTTDFNALGTDVHMPVDKIEQESIFSQHDVAIVHVNMEDTASIQLGDSLDVKPLDNLTIIGFPGNADISDKNDPTQELTSSVNKIYVSALKQTDTGSPVIEVGGNVEHGDSGGPALDSKGNIVGIVSFGLAASDPQGTSFLQTSNSALTLLKQLGLNTTPGPFEKAWQQAFADYASTKPGHWHKAQQELQQLSDKYGRFNAVEPYLNYAQGQARSEKLPAQTSNKQANYIWAIILGGIAFVVLILLGSMIFFMSRRKKHLPFVPVAPYAASMMQPTPLDGASPNVPAYAFSEWSSQRPLETPTSPQGVTQAATPYKEMDQGWQQQDLGFVAPAQTPQIAFPPQFPVPTPKQESYITPFHPTVPVPQEYRIGDDSDNSSTDKQAPTPNADTFNTYQ